jgi:hypothetical protein
MAVGRASAPLPTNCQPKAVFFVLGGNVAKGRFISNTICADKKINLLSDDTSRLAFTWLVTLADCEGRTYGDPAVLRSMLFPRRQDVTIERMEIYIKEWADNGMVLWYEAGGDKWICFPNFDKHQAGLRKDREAPSIIPPYSEDAADKLRTNSGVGPDQIRVKLSEVNVIESESTTPSPLSHLSAVVATKLKVSEYTGGAARWNKAIGEILDAGATDEDIDAAINYLDEKGLPIAGPWSIVQSVIIAKGQRERGIGTGHNSNGSKPKSHRRGIGEFI